MLAPLASRRRDLHDAVLAEPDVAGDQAIGQTFAVQGEHLLLSLLSDGRWPNWRPRATPFALAVVRPLLAHSLIRPCWNSASPAMMVRNELAVRC
jgi:hypothetical protein